MYLHNTQTNTLKLCSYKYAHPHVYIYPRNRCRIFPFDNTINCLIWTCEGAYPFHAAHLARSLAPIAHSNLILFMWERVWECVWECEWERANERRGLLLLPSPLSLFTMCHCVHVCVYSCVRVGGGSQVGEVSNKTFSCRPLSATTVCVRVYVCVRVLSVCAWTHPPHFRINTSLPCPGGNGREGCFSRPFRGSRTGVHHCLMLFI